MHRNRQGRSPSPPHPDDTPRAGSSGSPPLPSVPQGSSVSESIPPEHAAATSSTTGALTDPNPYPMYSPHAVATRSSFISVAVPVRPSTHTILDTSAVRTSTPLQPRHSSEGSVQLDSTVGLVPASGSPPPQPPPSTTKPTFTTLPEHVYNPRGDFYQPLNSPGVTTQAGSSSQAPFPPPHVPRPVRARSQHVARSRISLGNGNGEHDPNAEAGGAVSWIVPEKPSPVLRAKTVEERLNPTLEQVKKKLEEIQFTAKSTGWSLNVAIGAQVLLGALTTGIAAATTGRATSIATSILGGLSTIAASYLAKTRGTGEPEASIARYKDLEQFQRDCQAFILDRGHLTGDEYDPMINGFRHRLEEVLGNTGEAVGDKVGKEKEKEKVPPV